MFDRTEKSAAYLIELGDPSAGRISEIPIPDTDREAIALLVGQISNHEAVSRAQSFPRECLTAVRTSMLRLVRCSVSQSLRLDVYVPDFVFVK